MCVTWQSSMEGGHGRIDLAGFMRVYFLLRLRFKRCVARVHAVSVDGGKLGR